jgi:hypothetical protein
MKTLRLMKTQSCFFTSWMVDTVCHHRQRIFLYHDAVVGTTRLKLACRAVAAIEPTISPMTPPPKATSVAFFDQTYSPNIYVRNLALNLHVLNSSPSGRTNVSTQCLLSRGCFHKYGGTRIVEAVRPCFLDLWDRSKHYTVKEMKMNHHV